MIALIDKTQQQAGKAAKEALRQTYGVTVTYTDPAVAAVSIITKRGRKSLAEATVAGAQVEVIKQEFFIPFQNTQTVSPRKGGKIVDESANWWVDSVEADMVESHWKCSTTRYLTTALGVE